MSPNLTVYSFGSRAPSSFWLSGIFHVPLTATAAAQDGDPRVFLVCSLDSHPTCSTRDQGKYAKRPLGEAFIALILNTSV